MNGAFQYIWYPLAVWEMFRAGWNRMRDFQAVQSARFAPPASAFVSQPEPRSYGVSERGVQILAGNHLFNGEVIEIPGQSLWSLPASDALTRQQLHGFGWLDDVAAVDTAKPRPSAVHECHIGRLKRHIAQATHNQKLFVCLCCFGPCDRQIEPCPEFLDNLADQNLGRGCASREPDDGRMVQIVDDMPGYLGSGANKNSGLRAGAFGDFDQPPGIR